MPLTENAVKYLRAAKEAILAEPLRLDMSVWVQYIGTDPDVAPACGTVGCIAGWFGIEKYRAEHQGQFPPRDSSIGITAAQDAVGEILAGLTPEEKEHLGISAYSDDDELDKLFVVSQWPAQFREPYHLVVDDVRDYKTRQASRAKIVAERIEYFIEHLA